MSGREDTDFSGATLAQGDLAVNLFIVLLFMLSILTLAQVSSSAEGYFTPYRHGTPDAEAGPPVLGWQPVLPAYPKLVVRGGNLHVFNSVPLSYSFAVGKAADLGPDVADTSRRLTGDPDPVSYQVFLRFYDGAGFPEALSSGTMALDALEEVEGQNFLDGLAGTAKLDLFIFPEDMQSLVPLVDALHARRIALRILALPSNDIFGFAQTGRDFGLERAFK